MKKKSVIALICAGIFASQSAAFAMSTRDFDNGMAKGISYFNRGLYYEAKDEFTWFKDYNYNKMNSGQQKYLDDYLNGTWNRIQQWEDKQAQVNSGMPLYVQELKKSLGVPDDLNVRYEEIGPYYDRSGDCTLIWITFHYGEKCVAGAAIDYKTHEVATHILAYTGL